MKSIISNVFFKLIKLLNHRSTDFYYTGHARPLNSINVNQNEIYSEGTLSRNSDKVAIVIQGPIVHKNNFTLETIKLYRRMYKNVLIILSTWDDLDEKQVSEFSEYADKVILNVKPELSGAHNLNFQAVSTLNGIKMAKELDCSYVLKTRADNRFYSKTTIPYLLTLLNSYPPNTKNINRRIIEIGSTVCAYRVWSMCDLFQFGHINDLINMWSFELDSRNYTAKEFFSKQRTLREVVESNVAEIFVHRNFAMKIGMNFSISSQDYYNFIRDCIIVIDKEAIDLIWYKYSPKEYNWVGDPGYGVQQNLCRIKHSDWLLLISNYEVDYTHINNCLHEREI